MLLTLPRRSISLTEGNIESLFKYWDGLLKVKPCLDFTISRYCITITSHRLNNTTRTFQVCGVYQTYIVTYDVIQFEGMLQMKNPSKIRYPPIEKVVKEVGYLYLSC